MNTQYTIKAVDVNGKVVTSRKFAVMPSNSTIKHFVSRAAQFYGLNLIITLEVTNA